MPNLHKKKEEILNKRCHYHDNLPSAMGGIFITLVVIYNNKII